VVRAGWGDPVEFSAAKVVSNARVAEKLHKVVLDVGELAGGYQKGGQYVQVRCGRVRRVSQRFVAAAGHARVGLACSNSTQHAHTLHPPQVKVGDGKPGFFAIASPPDPNNQGLLEFLIKAQGDAAEALAALSAGVFDGSGRPSWGFQAWNSALPACADPTHTCDAGAEVAVSPVMGKGFAVEKIPADSNPTVLMFATGA
jgi:hypothetical protein